GHPDLLPAGHAVHPRPAGLTPPPRQPGGRAPPPDPWGTAIDGRGDEGVPVRAALPDARRHLRRAGAEPGTGRLATPRFPSDGSGSAGSALDEIDDAG